MSSIEKEDNSEVPVVETVNIGHSQLDGTEVSRLLQF